MPRVHIRRGNRTDAGEVASVLKKAFLEYEHLYTREGFVATTPDTAAIRSRMQEGPLWIAHRGEQIVGTAAAVKRETDLYIRGILHHF